VYPLRATRTWATPFAPFFVPFARIVKLSKGESTPASSAAVTVGPSPALVTAESVPSTEPAALTRIDRRPVMVSARCVASTPGP